MENSEWDRKLDDLWERVSSRRGSGLYGPASHGGSPAVGTSAFHGVRESDAETIQFIRHHHKEEERQWKQMLELKEITLKELGQNLEETQNSLKDLKARYQAEQERSLQLSLDTSLRMEESGAVLRKQKASHDKEIKLLQEIVERTRLEIKSVEARLETLRKKRDDWEKKYAQTALENEGLKENNSKKEGQLGQAKEAVEKTLGELLSERKAKSDAEADKQRLSTQIKDLESRIEGLNANWEAERKEWRELWDRERSVWETHRQEFAAWEERLRSERQAWHEKLRGEEQKEVEYASQWTNILKEASQWSHRMAQVLKIFAMKGAAFPMGLVSEPVSRTVKRASRRAIAVAAVSIVAIGVLAFWTHDYRSRIHIALAAEYPLDLPNPTAMLSTGDGIWIADWEEGLTFRDKNDIGRTLGTMGQFVDEPFRPAAIALDLDCLWILDMAQLRFLKRSMETGKIFETVVTPGPAPAGLAHDGKNLWSFDAATGLVYRFAMDPKNGVEASFHLPDTESPLAMQWALSRTAEPGGTDNLWLLDTNGGLKRMALKDGSFKTVSSQEIGTGVLSFSVQGKVLWTLERREKGLPGSNFMVRKYDLKVY